MLYDEEKHPVILGKDNHVTKLIIRHHHEGVSHQGREFTLNAVRSAGYWVMSPRRMVKNCTSRCIICKRFKGQPLSQKMADLPSDRCQPAEAIINSKPLSVVYHEDGDTMIPLSPRMLLTMKPQIAPPPPGGHGKADLYAIARWRRAQHVIDEFWSRWRSEIIPRLLCRSKWQAKEVNL